MAGCSISDQKTATQTDLRAMDRLTVSFGVLNGGLILFGCVSVPVGVIELIIATFEPWAR